MNCALWLNRKKIYSASEISENLDAAALCGYFAAGSLLDWLYAHGGGDHARKLSKISPSDPKLCEKITKIFGGKPIKGKALGGGEKIISGSAGGSFSGSFSLGSYSLGSYSLEKYLLGSYSVGSYSVGSYSVGSYSVGSFALGSYLARFWATSGGFYNYAGSFYFGSFAFSSALSKWFWEWEWEWEQYFGSFSKGSFSAGSGGFGNIAALIAYIKGSGSFNKGSFSLLTGSFSGYLKLLGKFGSFRGFSSFPSSFAGSFGAVCRELPENNNIDEYDMELLESILGCRLNQFGYGIHNI